MKAPKKQLTPEQKWAQKQRKKQKEEAEREKDTIWIVLFVRKGSSRLDPKEDRYILPGVKAYSNPEKSSVVLQHAIETFQQRENVSDWKEIAESYEFDSYWYP